MDNLLKAIAYCVFLLIALPLSGADNPPEEVLGCGPIHMGISDFSRFGVTQPAFNSIGSPQGDVSICQNGAAYLTLQVDGFCEALHQGNPLNVNGLSGVKIYAYPKDAPQPIFDCTIEEGEGAIISFGQVLVGDIGLDISDQVIGEITDQVVNANEINQAILLGTIPRSAFCGPRVIRVGLDTYTGIQATAMIQQFNTLDGWPILSTDDGFFDGLIDLSSLSPGTSYTICAYLCGDGAGVPCINAVQDLKDSVEKSDSPNAHACQTVEITTSADCSEFELDAAFADPCSCEDPLNARNSAGEVVLFHDVLEYTPGAGFDVSGTVDPVNLMASNEFYLDSEGTQIVPSFYEIPFDPVAGKWILDIWHSPSEGWSGQALVPSGNQVFVGSNSCSDTICSAIPTMGQWALFILLLLLSSLAVGAMAFVKRRTIA